MGNSKVILLGVVSLTIGMYASKIQQADRRVMEIGGIRSEEYQAVELAKTGVDLAVNELSELNSGLNATRTKSLMGGTVTYVLTMVDADHEKITSTATFGSQTRTYVVNLRQTAGGTESLGWKKKNWGRWATLKAYVQPNQLDWKTQGDSSI